MFKYVIIIQILTIFLFSAEGKQTVNLTCKSIVQQTSRESPWKCPEIDSSLEMQLSDINYNTGLYTCLYRYKDTEKMAVSCIYRSKYYEENIKSVLSKSIEKVKSYTKLDFNKDFNFLKISITSNSQLLDSLQKLVNENIVSLKEFFDKAYKDKNSDMATIDKNLNEIDSLVKRHLIEPYTTNSSSIPKDSNFATFVIGLATLDPSVIKGYDPNTNKLIVTNDWKVNASEIIKADDKLDKEASSTIGLIGKKIWDFFFGGNIEKEKALRNYADTDKYNISTWIDIFEMKLWGWWYKFNEYFDVGYDVLSTQLLFLTMAFFAIGASVRGGVRYISNRDGGNSSGEIKMSEDSIVKTLGVLAIVGFFFISIPSAEKDPNTGREMKKNLTLAKQFIRFSLKEGSYYATMFADLGTASFLEYVTKKQGLFTGEEIRNKFASDVSQIAYYYPSYKITKECLSYYNIKLDDLLSSMDKQSLTINKNYNSSFMSSNNINSYSYNLCKKSAKLNIIIPKDIAYSAFETDARIKNIDDTMSKSINLLVRNHILLEDRMGWFNVASVPFTYFMMKNNDMFITNPIDIEEIEEKVERYSNNMGMKSGSDIKDKDFGAFVDSAIDKGDKFFALGANFITKYAMYNVLPGFSSIRNSINNYLDNTYRDLLLEKNEEEKISKKSINTLQIVIRILSNYGKKMIPLKLISSINRTLINHPVFAHTLFVVLSYMIAIGVWKMGFSIIFISSIITLIGVKIVMFTISVIKHFTISLFVVVWAFARDNNGILKATRYAIETIVLAIYPSIIVLGVFIFIFSYELFYTLYGFITNILLEGEMKVVSLNAVANISVDSFLSYFTLYTLRDFTEIMIDVFSFFVAISTIYKFPENVLKMFGLDDTIAHNLNKQTEEISQRGERNVNPLS